MATDEISVIFQCFFSFFRITWVIDVIVLRFCWDAQFHPVHFSYAGIQQHLRLDTKVANHGATPDAAPQIFWPICRELPLKKVSWWPSGHEPLGFSGVSTTWKITQGLVNAGPGQPLIGETQESDTDHKG